VEQPKVLVQDWFKDRQTQIKVQTAIETVLNDNLPESYDRNVFKSKSEKLFDLVFEYASRGMKWAA
jgi:type I restriction enzyme R subunit